MTKTADDSTIRFAVLIDVQIGKSTPPANPADKLAAAPDAIHRLMSIPAVTASCDAFTCTDDCKDTAKAPARSWWALTSIRTACPHASPTSRSPR